MIVDTPCMEERQAITRLKRGDLDGMEILVRNHQVRAVHTAYLIVRDRKLAEDIVQNAFLQAAQKIHQFDERRPFAPWFLRSVVNAAIKADRRQRRFVPLDPTGGEDTAPFIEWLCDPSPGPDQIIETEETRRMVWQALGQLSTEQRAAVIMRHFLGMSPAEMTRETGRPSTTIRWWLRTARNRLRKSLYPFWRLDHPSEDEEEVRSNE